MRRPSNQEIREAFEAIKAKAEDLKTARDVNRRANRLLKHLHPDVGGCTQAAQRVNVARDILICWIEEGRPYVDGEGAAPAREEQEEQARNRERERARREEARREAARAEAQAAARAEEAARARRRKRIVNAAALAAVLAVFFARFHLTQPEPEAPPPPTEPGLPLLREAAMNFSLGALGLQSAPPMGGYEQFRFKEHLKWAEGRTLLECVYGAQSDPQRMLFWRQDAAPPYGIAWARVIEGHPFARVGRGFPACPPDSAMAAAAPPYGLALEIEGWQSPRTAWKDGELIEVPQPPELHCLYWRPDGLNWLVYEERDTYRTCPSRYDGPAVKGVLVRTSRFR